jgi:hypothetical protein
MLETNHKIVQIPGRRRWYAVDWFTHDLSYPWTGNTTLPAPEI